MDKTALTCAIALLSGYAECQIHESGVITGRPHSSAVWQEVPNYTESLDAMREAEQLNLKELVARKYWGFLMKEEKPFITVRADGEENYEMIGHWNSSALQHAKAFVKCLQNKG